LTKAFKRCIIYSSEKKQLEKARAECNVVTLEAFMIFTVCLIGCAYTSWKAGHEKGILATLHYLEKEGVISLSDEG